MPLFVKEVTPTEDPELTPEIAQIIFDRLVSCKCSDNITKVFIDLGHKIKLVKQVFSEAKSLETQCIQYVKDNPSCTKAQALANITSELLDVAEVGKQIIVFNPNHDESRTFTQFKAAYQPE